MVGCKNGNKFCVWFIAYQVQPGASVNVSSDDTRLKGEVLRQKFHLMCRHWLLVSGMTFETSQTTLYRVTSCHACIIFSPDSFEFSKETLILTLRSCLIFKKCWIQENPTSHTVSFLFLESSNDQNNNRVPQGFTVQQWMHFYCLECKSAKRDEYNPFSATSVLQKNLADWNVLQTLFILFFKDIDVFCSQNVQLI